MYSYRNCTFMYSRVIMQILHIYSIREIPQKNVYFETYTLHVYFGFLHTTLSI